MDTTTLRRIQGALIVGGALALAACAGPRHGHGPAGERMGHEEMMKRPMAQARYAPATAVGAAGRVMFHELDGPRLYLHAKLSGLPPGKPVGLALRDGACATETHDHASRAAPTGPAPALPTLDADARGSLDVKRVVEGARLGAVTGRALLLQAGTGGPTLACAAVAAGHHGAH